MRKFLTYATVAVLIFFSLESQGGEQPSAIVEDISGTSAAVTFMDYLQPGQKVELTAKDQISIGYLQSCIREVIIGGSITIGLKQSTVNGGKVSRERVECDGGNLQNMAATGSNSAVTVFRESPSGKSKLPRSQLTIYGTTPVVSLSAKSTNLKVERLDKKAKLLSIKIQNKVNDFAQHNIHLSPGGLYRLSAGQKSVVFSVDPLAEDKSISLLQRLIQL